MIEYKCSKNLYNMINDYYNKINKEYKKELNEKNFDKLEEINEFKKQQLLNYNTSIYKNIENKKIPFTELFDVNNDTPYMLTSLETELLRHYIGLYDEGRKQSVNELSKRFGISRGKVSNTLQIIMLYFGTELFQNLFIEEKNKMIKNNIKILYKKILEYDISFLNITNNFIEILRAENINTINDILNISYKQIRNMNIEYGYNAKIVVFPKRIIEEIHSLGLKFKDEQMIENLFDKIKDESITSEVNLGNNLETLIDLICARQFEPELLNRLNVKEQLYIDAKINNSYLLYIYNDVQKEMLDKTTRSEYEKKLDLNYTNGKTYYMDKN